MSRKLIAILQFTVILCLQNLNGQVTDTTLFVSLDKNTVTAGELITQITQQTNYIFSYDTRIVDEDALVSLQMVRLELFKALDLLSGALDLNYSLIDNYVVLYKKYATGRLQLHGTIIDANTGEPIKLATIGLRNRGIGTVTNNDGNFLLNILPDYLNDTVIVSHIGYQNSKIVAGKMYDNNMVIIMYRDYLSIPEIIVRVRDPLSILDRTLGSIVDNYGNTPAMLTGFYREGVSRRKELQIYSEAVVQIFKSSYGRSFVREQVKVLQSRKIENTEAKDTLAIRLEDGIQTIFELDAARNLFDFMNPESYDRYNYRLTDIVMVDEGTAFVISFEQQDWVEEPLFKGDIYINAEDYAILMIEFELNQSFINQINDEYVVKVPNSFIINTDYVRYSVQYRKEGDRYYLSHVRGDLGFIAKGKRKLFNSHYNVFVELAVTGFQTEVIDRFNKEEIVPSRTIFSNTINEYDSKFWKEFDFIPPDESLQKSLQKLKIKLSEYTGSLL